MAGKGKAKTGGRKKGVPNKATAEVKALAQEHGPEMIRKLLALTKSEDERIQLVAMLDRGYGKAAQAVEMTTDVGENFVQTLKALQAFRGNGAIPADPSEMD